MVRVLHIMAGADAGGISAVVLNYYQRIDRNRICFDIALTTNADGQNGQRLRALGADFYTLPMKSQGLTAFEDALTALLRSKRYDVIHVHENETSYVALRIAKRCGISKRFAHSHTSAPCSSFKGKIRRLSGCVLNRYYATRMVACGQLAGDRVFGRWNMNSKKAVVLPNAIDTEKFAYRADVRQQMRSELAVEKKYVIGMVGRLSKEKNIFYALHIVEKFHAKMPHVAFFIVGNGELDEEIRQYVRCNGMEEYVCLFGRRNDVDRLYQAMDVLMMPSLYEGYPVAAVEAMASGLPVLLASTITKELSFYKAAQYIPLCEDERWLSALERWVTDVDRHQRCYEVRPYGLDIRDAARKLEKLYLDDAER